MELLLVLSPSWDTSQRTAILSGANSNAKEGILIDNGQWITLLDGSKLPKALYGKSGEQLIREMLPPRKEEPQKMAQTMAICLMEPDALKRSAHHIIHAGEANPGRPVFAP